MTTASPGPAVEAVGLRRVFSSKRRLYNRLTARQNLQYWCALYKMDPSAGRKRTDALLERVGLRDRADDRVQTFSRGMRQRLHLARGLVHDPPVVFLDEPSTGLDPIAARDLRAIVQELAGEGRTILITTHDMAEAEAVCNRVTLIDHGRLLATETPQSLSRTLSRFERIECEGAGDDVLAALRSAAGVLRVTAAGAVTRIEVEEEAAVGEVMRLVASPSSPLVVLMGRGASFVGNGLITSLGAALIVAPLFDVSLPWTRYPALVALLVLVTLATYMAATFLAGLILKTPSLQRTVANVGRLVLMTFCGVNVPRSFFPAPVEWVSACLPLTHGLDAVRELYGAARPGVMLGQAATEATVLVGWLVLALLSFRRLADAGRNDGSIVFSAG